MSNDINLEITTGSSAASLNWKNETITWSDFVKKLSDPIRTRSTVASYAKSSKADRDRIKDVGGYVGGYMVGGRRLAKNILNRQLVTLDIDFCQDIKDLESKISMLGYNAVLHATHSNREGYIRLRLILPLSRPVQPEEYEPVARMLASNLDINIFDKTTFQTTRLMYWAACPEDAEYYFKQFTGEYADPKFILSLYTDWTNISEWSFAGGEIIDYKSMGAKLQDPLEKTGVIGAFCKAYTITQAIQDLLGNVYEPTSDPGRWSYRGGSTTGGLVIYEDKYAYSHHGTDPANGNLHNVYDLVRIHKYPDLTEKQGREAMAKYALELKPVKSHIIDAKTSSPDSDFSAIIEATDNESDEWKDGLDVGKSGIQPTAKNFSLILRNDAGLRGIFKYNELDRKRYLNSSAPWRKIYESEPMRSVDLSGLRSYIEVEYGISSKMKVDDALALEMEFNKWHPLQDYLNSLVWDGVNRVDSLFIRYLGENDNIYTREAARMSIVGAVTRIMEPGSKFELVPVLVGKQGTGKSTFIQKLGAEYFSDTFTTIKGQKSFEQLAGFWFIEMGELAALNGTDVDSVKQYISTQKDTYRPAYGDTVETYPRQCVFWGTTNRNEFLKDVTGDRRFLPIMVNIEKASADIWLDLDKERDQIFAEAMYMYRSGQALYLSKEASDIADKARGTHSETDDRTGIIEAYLDQLLPTNWDNKIPKNRAGWLIANSSNSIIQEVGSVRRDSVSVYEIWCECFNLPKEDLTKKDSREINDIMRSLPNWSPNGMATLPHYGRQRVYKRIDV